MRLNEHFPDDQAEIVWCEPFLDAMRKLTHGEREEVAAQVVGLLLTPWGKHALSNKPGQLLAGLNTLSVLDGQRRVVFRSRVVGGVGVLEVLCLAPRRDGAVYDLATALVAAGSLDADEITAIWDALAVLDVQAEQAGLDGWDYAPEPAPSGMTQMAVSTGLLDEAIAAALSLDEMIAAMDAGWAEGKPDPQAAMTAALDRARCGVRFDDAGAILRGRLAPRCGKWMPRARATCIRRDGHPGACRSTY